MNSSKLQISKNQMQKQQRMYQFLTHTRRRGPIHTTITKTPSATPPTIFLMVLMSFVLAGCCLAADSVFRRSRRWRWLGCCFEPDNLAISTPPFPLISADAALCSVCLRFVGGTVTIACVLGSPSKFRSSVTMPVEYMEGPSRADGDEPEQTVVQLSLWLAHKHFCSPMLPSRCPDARHWDNICDGAAESLHSNSDEDGDGFEMALADDARSKVAIPTQV